MKFLRQFNLIAAVLLSTFLFPASYTAVKAMSVKPIVLEMSAAGNSNRAQLSVLNDASKPLPVEIIISQIELDENGGIVSKPAGDEFLIFPPQALIPAGATQSFRVQWVGDQIEKSQSYVFSVNQVPVKMPEGTSGVQIVFNFATIVNVAPQGGQSSIDLIEAGVGEDDKGKTRPTVTVKNSGNSHAKLTDATIKLSSGSWSQTLAPEQLRQTMGVGLVQPGKTRRFLLPVDLPDGVKQISASIDYKPGK